MSEGFMSEIPNPDYENNWDVELEVHIHSGALHPPVPVHGVALVDCLRPKFAFDPDKMKLMQAWWQRMEDARNRT